MTKFKNHPTQVIADALTVEIEQLISGRFAGTCGEYERPTVYEVTDDAIKFVSSVNNGFASEIDLTIERIYFDDGFESEFTTPGISIGAPDMVIDHAENYAEWLIDCNYAAAKAAQTIIRALRNIGA